MCSPEPTGRNTWVTPTSGGIPTATAPRNSDPRLPSTPGLGYSSAANTDLSDTLLRARNAGVLTEGEVSMLERDPFLRAELVYISYYALEAQVSGTGRTLGERLMEKGVFTQWERDTAPPVASWRF